MLSEKVQKRLKLSKDATEFGVCCDIQLDEYLRRAAPYKKNESVRLDRAIEVSNAIINT